MPKEINGLPLHPLVVHAVVVLVPLLALVAVLFLVPRFRRSLRWPMVLLAIVALVSTFVARESGKNLKDSSYIPDSGPIFDAVQEHQHLANQLWYLVIAFVIVVLIAAYVLRPDDEFGPFPGRRGDAENEEGAATLDSVVRAVVATLVIVGAVAVVV
ncbi:MAG: DUF2231 domain-containing protein, partial [Nocardioidaceae bacterium]